MQFCFICITGKSGLVSFPDHFDAVLETAAICWLKRRACAAVLEGVMGVLVMVNGWAFILRLLHALSGASIFFLVLEKSMAVAVNEFGGIFVVTLLMLLGAAACNFVLLGKVCSSRPFCLHSRPISRFRLVAFPEARK